MSKSYDLGFLGGGQLARMSIQAAQRMGLTCISLDPGEVTPASQVAAGLVGALHDPHAIAAIFRQCEKVTLENEFVPSGAVARAIEVSGRTAAVIVPSIKSLRTIQDKLRQREAYAAHNVPSPYAVALNDDGRAAVKEIGFPMVLKSRFGGYDGKGTRYARTQQELEEHKSLWAEGGWLAEQFVPFKRELAVMVVIDESGARAFPTMETIQTNHVCDLVFPCDVDASAVAIQAVKAIGGHGLLGVELFQTEDGKILVNEIAPRPHNSGHYTLDWGGPSQFEAHIRVALGLPQIEPRSNSFAVMANLLGQEEAKDLRKATAAALSIPGVFVHWYGKENRPGRKMGHLNATPMRGESVQETVEKAKTARSRFYQAWAH